METTAIVDASSLFFYAILPATAVSLLVGAVTFFFCWKNGSYALASPIIVRRETSEGSSQKPSSLPPTPTVAAEDDKAAIVPVGSPGSAVKMESPGSAVKMEQTPPPLVDDSEMTGPDASEISTATDRRRVLEPRIDFINLFQAGISHLAVQASSLARLSSYKLAGNIILTITTGYLEQFDSYPKGLLVLPANEKGKSLRVSHGKSSLDNAIKEELEPVRQSLFGDKQDDVLCKTGTAYLLKSTPRYLKTKRVAIAVGPDYKKLHSITKRLPEAVSVQMKKADSLLGKTYMTALEIGEDGGFEQICVPLISGASFDGQRDNHSQTVAEIGVEAMVEWATITRSYYEDRGFASGNCLIDIIWNGKDKEQANMMSKAARKVLKGAIKACAVKEKE